MKKAVHTNVTPLAKARAKRLEQYAAMPLSERDESERWVTMDNALNRAGHGLTLAEKRLVCLAVSKIDSRRPIHPMQPPKTRISAAEYVAFCGVSFDTAYDQLKSAAAALYSRSITFFEPASKRGGKPIKPARHVMRWVGEAIYHENEGWVELHWWPALVPSLFGLKRNFTSYQLHQASALRSAYSWRLLELLMRFEAAGWAEYTVEDFAASMDATPKMQENFNNIKKRIIEPAVKELIEKDGWLIQWEPLKKGRRVAALRFDFSRNPQGRLL